SSASAPALPPALRIALVSLRSWSAVLCMAATLPHGLLALGGAGIGPPAGGRDERPGFVYKGGRSSKPSRRGPRYGPAQGSTRCRPVRYRHALEGLHGPDGRYPGTDGGELPEVGIDRRRAQVLRRGQERALRDDARRELVR